MSLKATLHSRIKELNGNTLTYAEFEDICKRENQRTETGTRRIQELVAELYETKDEIYVLTSKKGAVVGWACKKVYSQQNSLPFAVRRD